MEFNRLNKMCKTIFGIPILPIYEERKLAKNSTIMVTELCSNGFFFAQFEDELVSQDFMEAFNIMSNASSVKSSFDSQCEWCVAKYEGEYFRGYIEESLAGNKCKIYFIDYGTTSVVNESDIKFINNDSLWLCPPLGVPFVIKSKLLYSLVI